MRGGPEARPPPRSRLLVSQADSAFIWRKATATMADDFGKKVPGSAEIIAEFKKRTGG